MRNAALASALVALALALAGCTSGAGSSPGAGGGGGTFVYARGSDSVLLDPQKIDDGESVLVCANVFDSLVRYKRDSIEIEPALATKWTRSDDGKAWTFELREGVKFHDGTPFDADAVVFAFERITKKDHPFHDAEILNETLYQDIERVEKISPFKVVFHLRRPLAPDLFLGNLTVYTAFIPSPTALRKDPRAFGRAPVGTGAWRLVRWEPDQRIVLEANKDYWGGAPAIDKVVVLVVKENSSRRNMLEAGEVHAIDGLNPIDVEPLSRNPAIRVLKAPGMSVAYLALNCKKPPLDDPAVRNTIASAAWLKAETIVRVNFQGLAKPASQVTPPILDRYEIERGWKMAGTSARRLTLWAMPNPRPYLPEPKKTAEILKEALAEKGIECEIVTYPWDVYLAKTRQGEHDMCLLGWTADVADPDNFLFTFFGSVNMGGTNYSFYENKDVDEKLIAAQAEPDAGRRHALYGAVETKIANDAPLIPLVHAERLAAIRADVEGFESHPTGRSLFDKISFKKK
jgi:peptide/nickel transport system substrate-binding protein